MSGNTVKVVIACVCIAVLSGGLMSAQQDVCRGTAVDKSETDPDEMLKCTGDCGDEADTCLPRNGTGTWANHKTCACEQGENRSACGGLAIKQVGGEWKAIRVGDCIGCGFADRICVKVESEFEIQMVCQVAL